MLQEDSLMWITQEEHKPAAETRSRRGQRVSHYL
jgi:hypothetical protein